MMAKTLQLPPLGEIKDPAVKVYLEKQGKLLQKDHEDIYNEMKFKETLEWVTNGVHWRITVEGDDFIVQKLIGSTWTDSYRWQG